METEKGAVGDAPPTTTRRFLFHMTGPADTKKGTDAAEHKHNNNNSNNNNKPPANDNFGRGTAEQSSTK